jgi:hypothetical protein
MDHLKIARAIANEIGLKVYHRLPSYAGNAASLLRPPTIWSRWPDNDEDLEIFSHEAGHIACGHLRPIRDIRQACKEMEATRWGHDAIRRHGGEITKPMTKHRRHAIYTYLHDPNPSYGTVAPCRDAHDYVDGKISL